MLARERLVTTTTPGVGPRSHPLLTCAAGTGESGGCGKCHGATLSTFRSPRTGSGLTQTLGHWKPWREWWPASQGLSGIGSCSRKAVSGVGGVERA